jgi:hypothetical protein
VKNIVCCFGVICFLFFGLEVKGQQTKAQQDAAIKQAKQTAVGAGSAFNPYRKFSSVDSIRWLFGGDASLAFNATSLTNWAAGGEDQFSIRSAVNLFANYKKGKRTLENYATFGYGFLKTGERKAVKNDDRLHFHSKVSHAISPKWAYSSMFLARTQFTPGYKYAGEEIVEKLSDFLAPINLYLSIGLDYTPNKNISCMLSPVMGRATFVRSDSLSIIIAAGMLTTDADGNQVRLQKRYEYGGGALVKFNGNLIKDKVTYSSHLELFSNFIQKPENVEVYWVFNTKMMLYKNITANMQFELKYDDNQKTKNDETGELEGHKVKIKYFTGLGLFYQF